MFVDAGIDLKTVGVNVIVVKTMLVKAKVDASALL